jgi:vacuolar-type H+-ATPase subunit H
MPALGEILRRFRFHGVPGAPTAAAVPSDRTAELEGELAPVFAALEGAQRSAGDATAHAEERARARRAEAAAEGQRIVAEARAGVAAARDEAASARLAAGEEECRRVRAAGQAEAARVRRVAAQRSDALVELVVAHVLALTGTPRGEEQPGT